MERADLGLFSALLQVEGASWSILVYYSLGSDGLNTFAIMAFYSTQDGGRDVAPLTVLVLEFSV